MGKGSERLARISSLNMAKTQSNMDPMIPGNKIVAIFGFFDILSFSKLTNVLQEGIIVFINEITDLVYWKVDQFSRLNDMNIGNTILLA